MYNINNAASVCKASAGVMNRTLVISLLRLHITKAVAITSILLLFSLIFPVNIAQAESEETRLDKLVEPIALYPDALLAQILPASTFPVQVVNAARYLRSQGDDIDLIPDNDWHPSVKALLSVPPVLEKMNAELAWTIQLGEAVKSNQEAVLQAIQRVREFAYEGGELVSNDKQVIIVEQEVIKIEPPTPEVIYVPQYYTYPSSSTVVYRDNNDDQVFAGFAVGLIIGAAIADNHYFDWHHFHFRYSSDVYRDIRHIRHDRQQFVRERHKQARRDFDKRQQRRDHAGQRRNEKRINTQGTGQDRPARSGQRIDTGNRADRQQKLKDRQPDQARYKHYGSTQNKTSRDPSRKPKQGANIEQYNKFRSKQTTTNRNISRQRQQSLSRNSGLNQRSSLFGSSRKNTRAARGYSRRGVSSRRSTRARSGGGRRIGGRR